MDDCIIESRGQIIYIGVNCLRGKKNSHTDKINQDYYHIFYHI
jgi:hypothetical protein